jgi:UDP-N-acetylglucosamine 2-epimerase
MQPIYRTNPFVTVEGNGRGRTNAYIKGSGIDVGADIFRRGLCLPSDNKMTPEQQDRVIEIIHGEKLYETLLYSCHPRSKKRLEATGFKLDPRVRVNEPLGFNDYNKLQMNALAIVSDSGTLPEESSFYLSIGHPIAAVCIRTSTERPEALEAGDFILAGITTNELLNATSMAIEMKQKGVLGKPCPDYVDETVSMKVVRIIQGYVGVVNKMVWRKF